MPMEDNELEDLVKTWIDHALRGGDELFWAWDRVTKLTTHDPESVWPIILDLIQAAPNDQVLANIGAGPLEDLLCWHGAAFIERVEQAASRNSRFRKSLAATWGWNRMPGSTCYLLVDVRSLPCRPQFQRSQIGFKYESDRGHCTSPARR